MLNREKALNGHWALALRTDALILLYLLNEIKKNDSRMVIRFILNFSSSKSVWLVS